MPSVWNKDKRLSVHITPERRAAQLPNDLYVCDGQLCCQWCKTVITTLRLDNIRAHLRTLLHKDNKRKFGVLLTSDNGRLPCFTFNYILSNQVVDRLNLFLQQ